MLPIAVWRIRCCIVRFFIPTRIFTFVVAHLRLKNIKRLQHQRMFGLRQHQNCKVYAHYALRNIPDCNLPFDYHSNTESSPWCTTLHECSCVGSVQTPTLFWMIKFQLPLFSLLLTCVLLLSFHLFLNSVSNIFLLHVVLCIKHTITKWIRTTPNSYLAIIFYVQTVK